MESIIRVTAKSGEVFDLCRPDSKDDQGWNQVYAIVGQAQCYEIIPQPNKEG